MLAAPAVCQPLHRASHSLKQPHLARGNTIKSLRSTCPWLLPLVSEGIPHLSKHVAVRHTIKACILQLRPQGGSHGLLSARLLGCLKHLFPPGIAGNSRTELLTRRCSNICRRVASNGREAWSKLCKKYQAWDQLSCLVYDLWQVLQHQLAVGWECASCGDQVPRTPHKKSKSTEPQTPNSWPF